MNVSVLFVPIGIQVDATTFTVADGNKAVVTKFIDQRFGALAWIECINYVAAKLREK